MGGLDLGMLMHITFQPYMLALMGIRTPLEVL